MPSRRPVEHRHGRRGVCQPSAGVQLPAACQPTSRNASGSYLRPNRVKMATAQPAATALQRHQAHDSGPLVPWKAAVTQMPRSGS